MNHERQKTVRSVFGGYPSPGVPFDRGTSGFLRGRIFTSRRKTSAACAADRATGSRDTKHRNRESESEAKEYHPHTRINTLNYPSTKAGQVQTRSFSNWRVVHSGCYGGSLSWVCVNVSVGPWMLSRE
jgi:hypothetical protein